MLNGYRVILNKFDIGVTDPVLNWIFYLLNTVMIVIVLLPLLVSIMKDTFGTVMRTKVTQDYREKTSLCLEYESLMFWRRNKESRQYLHAIRYKGETVKQTDPVRKNIDKLGEELGKEIDDRHLKNMKQIEELRNEVADLKIMIREVSQLIAAIGKEGQSRPSAPKNLEVQA